MAASLAGRTLFVVVYDISNDRRRTRVHKILSGFGQWTQFSVFECFLNAKELVLLHARLREYLKIDEDNVRFYPLCQSCCDKVETIGSAKPSDPVTVII
jgi:CRISPR-associated protein Cas2